MNNVVSIGKKEEESKPVDTAKPLSDLLRGIQQLILAGMFPATHATLIVQVINVLDILASNEEKKEAEEKKEEPVSEVPAEEPAQEVKADE